MARRAAPPNSGPSYLPPSSHSLAPRLNVDPNESRFQRFLREQVRSACIRTPRKVDKLRQQVYAPEKIQGNISIVTGVGMFLGGIVAVRLWGEALVGDI